MATKHSNKKKKYDHALLDKLEAVTTSVASKNFYTIAKNKTGFYDLIDYKRNRIIIQDIPTEAIAEKICKRYNAKGYSLVAYKKIIELINYYQKLFTDCIYYTKTITETDDDLLRNSVNNRYYVAQDRMRETVKTLKTVI